VIEIGYAAFIWPKKTRAIWLLSVLGMHLGIGLAMGLALFALIMVILNISAFAPGLFFKKTQSSSHPLAASLRDPGTALTPL
jgi:hypothetical protein